MALVNRGLPHPGPKNYVEYQRLLSFAIKELRAALHITTYYAQYSKCAAAHLLYLHLTRKGHEDAYALIDHVMEGL
jgi:hypothetical protein